MLQDLILNSIFNINQALSSRYASALLMLTMNFGMGFVMQDIAPITNKIFSIPIMRKLVLFAIIFTGTRDFITTIVLLFVFILIFDFVLNEKSILCLLPKQLKSEKNNQPIIESAPKIINKQINNIIQSYKKNIAPSFEKTPVEEFINSKSPAEYINNRYS